MSMTSSTDYYFDKQAADRACTFFERYLVHIKGRWAGKPFKLEPWQRDRVIRPLFGWKRPDGTRRYRTVYVEIPRKNGKSTIAAGVGLYLLSADGEMGAEVYSAAADREQAAIVFDTARTMVQWSAPLNKRTRSYRRSLFYSATSSNYRVISADARTKHGFNAHGVLFDELHTQPNRELWDVLSTSTGSREQPVILALTTAGYDHETICWEIHEYARQVEQGIITDDSFLPVIYAADDDDDWLDPEVWKRANPSLGVTLSLDYLERAAEYAKQVPAHQNTFRRLHLNQWTQQAERWLDIRAWDASAGQVLEHELLGRHCFGGLDLASTTDIAAFVLVFPDDAVRPQYRTVCRFWIPEEGILERERRDRVPYREWVRQGWIHATPGNVIDYAYIRHAIRELGSRYNIREIAFDRWGATQLANELTDEGFVLAQFGQGYASMSPPTKELLNLVLSERLEHGGNPVLRWMADSMVVKQDPAGNVKPDKSKSTQRIDGMVALIMAIDRAVRHEESESVYETERLTII